MKLERNIRVVRDIGKVGEMGTWDQIGSKYTVCVKSSKTDKQKKQLLKGKKY